MPQFLLFCEGKQSVSLPLSETEGDGLQYLDDGSDRREAVVQVKESRRKVVSFVPT